MKKFLGAVALTFALGSHASAATITESTFGDFGDDEATITDVGSLDGGVNTISGQLSFNPCVVRVVGGCGDFDRVDAVSFVVPVGYEMVSASVTSTGSGFERYFAGLFDSTLSLLASDEFLVGSGGSISGGATLAAGKYVFVVTVGDDGGGSTDRTATTALQVPSFFVNYVGTGILRKVDGGPEVVPLPAGMPLILGALAMLGWAGRRRT